MFSESPCIRALAFSKHHILSVNNLVFVPISGHVRSSKEIIPYLKSEKYSAAASTFADEKFSQCDHKIKILACSLSNCQNLRISKVKMK